MTLANLISVLPEAKVRGPVDQEIKGLRYDSRRVGPQDLFFAWKGVKLDGHSFIPEACRQGSSAVVYEDERLPLSDGTTYIQVPRAREALARMADLFYGHPSRTMDAIGITGTNGKTTTAFVTKALLSKLGAKVGMLGTVRYEIGDRTVKADRTTPEGSDLQEFLSQMHQEHCTAFVMEVSSHALDQGRVAGVDFNVAVWTNLTQDHLDYHLTMEKYFAAKRILFQQLNQEGRNKVAVVNFDDAYFTQVIPALASHVQVITYSARGETKAALRAQNVISSADGTDFNLVWEDVSHAVTIPLLGRFNVENVLAAIGVVLGLGHPLKKILPHLTSLTGVPGRLERFASADGVTVVVDYAHTADALENVLKTLRGLSPRRLITIVGCGGDRDRTKRPLMAETACRLSDQVIFTADNPRSERLSDIFRDMKAGVPPTSQPAWVADRRHAIDQAIQLAEPGDLLCVAGKGHETVQEIAGEFHPFDDREVVRTGLKGRVA